MMMKKIVFTLFIMLLMQIGAVAAHQAKVAVVLSGGGAKGMAHIGVLKVLKQQGIPIDMVVGTSMGSIIGGLYALGYDPEQLDSLVRHQDWTTLLSDQSARPEQTISERQDASRYVYSVAIGKNMANSVPQGVVNGRNLDKMFKKLTVGYHHPVSFDSLATPFACVSTNAVDGSEYIFHRGVLAQAMRASMAIPGVFSPVRLDTMVLVDGGLVNNFPADVARQMGADVIIGVVFQNDKAKSSDLKSVAQVLNNIINIETRKKLYDNEKLCDLVLHVDVHGLSTASFTPQAIDSLIHYGEETAHLHLSEIQKLHEKIGARTYARSTFRELDTKNERFFIRQISFEGVNHDEEQQILHHCHLKGMCEMTFDEIEKAERQMTDELSYTSVTYTLEEISGGYRLTYLVSDRKKIGVRFGARLDNEEIASLLLNAQLHVRAAIPQTLDFTARLGKRSYGELGYNFDVSRRRVLGAFYRLEYNDMNVYNRGKRSYNVVYNLHRAGVRFQDDFLTNFRYELQWDFTYDYYRDFLHGLEDLEKIHSEHFFDYVARLDYDSYDKASFPGSGTRFFARYGLHTDNMWQYKGKAPFHTAEYLYEFVVPLSRSRLRLIPRVCGRHILGPAYGYSLSNFIGGSDLGHYFEQQMPFVGINNVELVSRDHLNVSACLREGIGQKNYVWLSTGTGVLSKSFYSMLRSRYLFGVEAGFGMESLLGPLRATIGYSNYTRKVNVGIDLGWHF